MCTHVCKCKNESTPGMGGREERRVVEEVNSSMIYVIHCKNFCKCHNVPSPSTTIKGKKTSG
jgi:hypothetical protein